MKRHGGNWHAYYQVKDANSLPRAPHCVTAATWRSRRGESMRQKRINDYRAGGSVGWRDGTHGEGSQGSETSQCDTVMVDPCCYTLVQTHRTYNTKNVNCGLRLLGKGRRGGAWLVHSVECVTLDLGIMSSNLMLGVEIT